MENNLQKIFTNSLSTDLKKIILSSARKKSQECRKTVIRPVLKKSGLLFQFEYHYEKKVIHENLKAQNAVSKIISLIEKYFKQADIFTLNQEIHILASKPDKPYIKIRRIASEKKELNKAASENLLKHDREKNYIIKDGTPVDFLIRLGVMDKDGRVIPKRYSKFRQINRFLEIVDDVADTLAEKNADDCADHTVRIIDFGCGKAYLTFALYYYFHEIKGIRAVITGLDLKQDVIDLCNKVAFDLDYEDLKFLHGDIADYKDSTCDMVVTLHACDTATDYALINAVKWNAPVILSVPCCQHELFRQIKNQVTDPVTKHGILKDRMTEILTDGLRGLALEARGYDVSMIEFTTLEHTQKNIMIRAVKRRMYDSHKSKRALRDYNALEKQFNVSCTIGSLLEKDQADRPTDRR